MKRYRTTSRKPKDGKLDDRIRGAERLAVVSALCEQGRSQREIAEELGWDEGVIRRDIEKLSLPKAELAAIESGETAEQFLNEARFRKTGKDRAAAAKQRRRLSQEKKKGNHSDHLSGAILDWLSKKGLSTANEQLLLATAEQDIEASRDHWGPPSPNLGNILTQCEPAKLPDYPPERLSAYIDVLVSALISVEPTKLIRQLALRKSTRAILAAERRPRLPDRWKTEYARMRKRRV